MSTAAIQLDAGDRWLGPGYSLVRVSRSMALIAVASLSAHLLLVVAAVVTSRKVPAPPAEISVEVVQEVPKPAPAPKPAPKAPEPAKRVATEAPKPAAERQAAKDEVKPPPAKIEPAKIDQAKIDQAKIDQAKIEPPKQQPAPPPRPQADAQEQKLAALQKELESLRAERASLETERAAAEARQAASRGQAPTSLRETGLGPLPSSFQAVALPAAADGAGEAMSYQEIVFSALAKAKGIGRTKGLPGSAGVRFSIDAAGRLVDLELVHKSGVSSLDTEALDIVRRAAPFPPPPQGAQRNFTANVNFVTGAQ